MPEALTLGPEPVLFTADFIGNAERGFLVSTQSAAHLPFQIRRVFWSYGVPTAMAKGNHAHHLDRKILIAVHGTVTIQTETDQFNHFVLNHPTQALYVPELCWIQLHYVPGSILLALSSTDYTPEDYIYDYQKFKNLRQTRKL